MRVVGLVSYNYNSLESLIFPIQYHQYLLLLFHIDLIVYDLKKEHPS